jgi:purine-binding chemotaxis protein CheW
MELTGDEEQIVSFRLGKETFAVKVAQVREIGKVQDITHIPKMPDYVEGVMNLRGQITTVIDLKKRFGIVSEAGAERTAQSRIIVAEIGDHQLGIIVDSVEDVMRVPRNSISPVPKTLSTGVQSSFLQGICKLQNKLIMLLDLGKMISDEGEMNMVMNASKTERAEA